MTYDVFPLTSPGEMLDFAATRLRPRYLTDSTREALAAAFFACLS